MRNYLDVHRDGVGLNSVPPNVRAELETLRSENTSLRDTRGSENLYAEIATAASFAVSGISLVMVLGADLIPAFLVIGGFIGGIFGLGKITSRSSL